MKGGDLLRSILWHLLVLIGADKVNFKLDWDSDGDWDLEL